MKIAFFTEIPNNGIKIPRDHENMRTEFAWMVALDADLYNIHEPDISKEYDLGIIIIPKKNPNFDIEKLRNKCKQISSMQEGPHWYFQDYDLAQQIWYHNTLQSMDFLFVHNKLDKKYYEGTTGKKCIVLPSLIIEDEINNLPTEDRTGAIIGGNFCSWYGGFDSFIIAQEFQEKLYIPSMGRKITGEESIKELTHLPYMSWKLWMQQLNKIKYGVHLMRTHAAGTFALNCAYLGIPCIGYKGLDTQEICHPFTSVDVGDMTAARGVAHQLKHDNGFYEHCAKSSKEKYLKHFNEKQFKNTFKKNLEEI